MGRPALPRRVHETRAGDPLTVLYSRSPTVIVTSCSVEAQLEGELLLAPDFPAPPSMDYSGYHQYVEDALPPESPYLYGLHPNAEIGFLTARADSLFRTVLELQPRLAAGSGGVTVTRDEKVGAS